ncbi:MAG: hypothetical protein K9N34_05325 [Candidatus Marinimicrobia bacterium]|nr:hypothetical protein [Candidatus Neomarinimicrobiota bacterium]MCF7840430.1 hypothetical protein [Candidatus Neomarinimicrobiota bacterium]
MNKPDILLVSLMNWTLCETFISHFGADDQEGYMKLANIPSPVQIATDLSRSGDVPVKYLERILSVLIENKPFASQNDRTALLLSLWVHQQLGRKLGADQIEAIIRTLKFRKSTTEQKVAMLMANLTT